MIYNFFLLNREFFIQLTSEVVPKRLYSLQFCTDSSSSESVDNERGGVYGDGRGIHILVYSGIVMVVGSNDYIYIIYTRYNIYIYKQAPTVGTSRIYIILYTYRHIERSKYVHIHTYMIIIYRYNIIMYTRARASTAAGSVSSHQRTLSLEHHSTRYYRVTFIPSALYMLLYTHTHTYILWYTCTQNIVHVCVCVCVFYTHECVVYYTFFSPKKFFDLSFFTKIINNNNKKKPLIYVYKKVQYFPHRLIPPSPSHQYSQQPPSPSKYTLTYTRTCR